MAKTLDQIALAAARAALMEMDPGAEWKTGYGAKKKDEALAAKARFEILDDSEMVIATADSWSDARYAAEKAEKNGERRVLIFDNQTGKAHAYP